jgi:hypothetical protein
MSFRVWNIPIHAYLISCVHLKNFINGHPQMKVFRKNRYSFYRCKHLPELLFVGIATEMTDAKNAIIIAIMTDFLRPNLRYK